VVEGLELRGRERQKAKTLAEPVAPREEKRREEKGNRLAGEGGVV
jgi:hypothetical protein